MSSSGRSFMHAGRVPAASSEAPDKVHNRIRRIVGEQRARHTEVRKKALATIADAAGHETAFAPDVVLGDEPRAPADAPVAANHAVSWASTFARVDAAGGDRH